MPGKCSPTLVAVAAPDNWTFLGKPDEQAVDFFHACERLGEVAEHAVATDRCDRVTLRDKATTKTATAVLEREVLPQAQAPPARASRPGTAAPASSPNKVLVNQRMKRANWSVDGDRNVLAFGAMSGRAAWRPERTARTTALNAA